MSFHGGGRHDGTVEAAVPEMSDVPEMMEHILVSAVITAVGVLCISAVMIKNDEK